MCLVSTYVVDLFLGNDAICLILALGYVTLVFLKAVKNQERSVIRVKIVPFELMRISVFDVYVALFLRLC